MKKNKKDMAILSARKKELFSLDASIIQFWRRNPVIACKDLLGIELLDAQKYILMESWTKPYALWCCSRNFGKSLLGAVYMMLKFLLFENQKIYIVAPAGSQSQETFKKIEDIAKKNINSMPDIEDIFLSEVVTNHSNKTGFVHNPASFTVAGHSGSRINSLNGNYNNNRSKRSSLVFFDEIGFASDEQIMVAEAFGAQNSDFIMSTKENFNLKSLFKKTPTQLIYASSASSTDTYFYKKYKEFAKNMIAGDRRYFVADIPCTIPLNPLKNGKPFPPLLKQEQVDDAIAQSPEKGRREYYNEFSADGGDAQPIKRHVVLRNSTNVLPVMFNENNKDKFIFAFDPARTYDNSICSVMRIAHDEKVGYYGEVVNCVSFVDVAKKKKTPMKTPDQVKYFKRMLLDYNGNKSPDYENILSVLIDSGAGGGGIPLADGLLEEWKGDDGEKHKGLIDLNHEQYTNEKNNYPDAVGIVQLISPKKYKVQMVEELIQLLNLDLIKFPQNYDGKDYINITVGENLDYEEYKLSMEEQIALTNIDVMKEESFAIRETKSGNNVSYDLPKDKQSTMGDDRFYTLLMLAHFLTQLRRKDAINKPKPKQDWSKAPIFVSKISF